MVLDARHETADAICAACPTPTGKPLPRSTLAAWRALPGWENAMRLEKGRLVRETDSLSAVVRHDALRETHSLIARGEADAALLRAALSSTQPTGADRLATAKRELLRTLTPATRALVAAELNDEGIAAGLTDDELNRLYPDQKP